MTVDDWIMTMKTDSYGKDFTITAEKAVTYTKKWILYRRN